MRAIYTSESISTKIRKTLRSIKEHLSSSTTFKLKIGQYIYMGAISKYQLISTKIRIDFPKYQISHAANFQEDRNINTSSVALKIEIGRYIYMGGISKCQPTSTKILGIKEIGFVPGTKFHIDRTTLPTKIYGRRESPSDVCLGVTNIQSKKTYYILDHRVM